MYRRRNIYLILFCLGIFICPFCSNRLWAKDFVVVIDAGHGGKDPGAVGKISKEKNINLKVALKVGNLIQNNCKDVKVVYTRNKDVFVALDRRAEIANNAKADLFVSIHTNSLASNNTVKGASTWTLGLARSQANLDVAKRENSVILYENDYQTRYAGFDPKSSESYIIFEFMQDKYMEQSVHLASLMQQQFKNTCKRVDKGVHQAEFLVLRATAMPSILVELGFISTPEEERYLNTDAGVNAMSKGIYQAFLTYKEEHDNRIASASGKLATASQPVQKPVREQAQASTTTPSQASAPKTTQAAAKNTSTPQKKDDELIFMVQITTSSSLLTPGDKKFKGLKGIHYYKEGNVYKYTYGASGNYNEIVKIRREVQSKFSDAFIIAFKNGHKINVSEAIKEFKNKEKKR